MSTSLKRQLEADPRTPERPKKRISLPASSPASTYRYPYIPSSPTKTPYPAKPFDSPSNPFGRKHWMLLTSTLPPPSLYSKHLVLRFQYFRPGRKTEPEVSRLVQVPLSYTFHHLKYVIFFLFGEKNASPAATHLFEVRKQVELLAEQGGVIRQGTNWIRLSSAQNPYLYKNDWEMDDDEQDDEPAPLEEKEKEGDGEVNKEPDWKWEAEEDFTLENVWSKPTEETPGGIIYYHDTSKPSGAQIHITLAPPNDKRVYVRKGRGNGPFVFCARGQVQLSTNPRLSDLKVELPVKKWNEPENTFERFFKRNSVSSFSGFFDEDEDDVDFSSSSPIRNPSTPGLVFSSSSSSAAFSSPPTTPAKESSSPAVEYVVPKYTPAPGRAQKKRIGNMERRIDKMKRKSMERLDKFDAQQDAPDPEPEEDQVDELADDNDDDVQPKALPETERTKKKRVRVAMLEKLKVAAKSKTANASKK